MYLFIKRSKKLVLVLNLPTSCDNLPTKCDKTVGFLTSTSKLLSFAIYRIRCDMLWAHCFSCQKTKKKGVFERNSVLMKEVVTEHVITLFPCDIIFLSRCWKSKYATRGSFCVSLLDFSIICTGQSAPWIVKGLFTKQQQSLGEESPFVNC